MQNKSGVAPEIMTAISRNDGATVAPVPKNVQTKLNLGTFAYQVPFEIPRGRKAEELSVALGYDMRASGNGPFGLGWDLGIPSINRRINRGIPHYDLTDKYSLFGVEIERTEGNEYRPLVEGGFSRTRNLSGHWEVIESDGTRLLFGETSNSRLHNPANPNHVARYFLSRREDPNGNLVLYKYMRDDSVVYPQGFTAAQLYLKSISYVNVGADDFLNTVVFDYQKTRADSWTSYRFGFPVRTNWLCKQAISFTSNIDGGADRIIDFAGVPYNATEQGAEGFDRYIEYGFYILSEPAAPLIKIDFPIALSGVTLSLDTAAGVGPAGGTYQIEETFSDGTTASRTEVSNGNNHDIVLSPRTTTVTVTALDGKLVVQQLLLPGARLPEITSRYRLEYRELTTEAVNVDLSDIPPPMMQLKTIQRFGYDRNFAEFSLPPMEFGYKPFSLKRLFSLSLDGTPNEAIGADTTVLGFYGTARPDLFQTVDSHRVYYNRGRVGAQIVFDGTELAESPSLKLSDPGVFLRDINARAAVDLSTEEVYYPNPSANGNVSRTSPSWQAPVDFDDTRRHPNLTPSQLALTRPIDLNLDGHTDLMTTDFQLLEFSNEGQGSWSPAHGIERQGSFGQFEFPDISFDNDEIFITDINGDGKDEIVRVSARKVEWWARDASKWTSKVTLANAPRIAEFDPRRVVFLDVTGNNAADLVYFHSNGIAVHINIGGHYLADPIYIDFNDFGVTRGIPMPSGTDSLIALDLLGTGTRGILWSLEREDVEPNYFFLQLSTEGKPFLLSSVDNGIGGRIEIDYSTSAIQAAEDEATAYPWAENAPYPVTVIENIREIDLITQSSVERRFRYRDAHYDRDDRVLRGFAKVEERILESEFRSGVRIDHYFSSGRPNSNSPEDRAEARALAGTEQQTLIFDLTTGLRLRETLRQTHVEPVRIWEDTAAGPGSPTLPTTATGTRTPGAPLYSDPDGDAIVFAFEQRRLDISHEGTTTPRYSLQDRSHLVDTVAGTVLEEFGRLVSETTYGEVLPGAPGAIVATFPIDGTPMDFGTIDHERQRRVTYSYAINRSANMLTYGAQVLTWAGPAFTELIAEQCSYYDGGTDFEDHLPLGEVSQGNLQRQEQLFARHDFLLSVFGNGVISRLGADETAGPGYYLRDQAADGNPGLFRISQRRIFQLGGTGQILFGAVLREKNGRNAVKINTYDGATWYIRGLQNSLGHSVIHEQFDYRAGKPTIILDENGTRSRTAFDAFGRQTEVTENMDAIGVTKEHTIFGSHEFVANKKPTLKRILKRIDRSETPNRFVEEIQYLDGWGRLLQKRTSSESHGNHFLVRSFRYDASGTEPNWESQPYWSPGGDYQVPGANQPGSVIRRDALNRVSEIVFPNGNSARVDYAPWTLTFWDPADLVPNGDAADTPTIIRFDYGGQPVEVETVVLHGVGEGSAELAQTHYTYDGADRLVQIEDAEGSLTNFEYSFSDNLLRVHQADAGDVLRMFAADGTQIYERNAIGMELWYPRDSLGRKTAEVLGPDPTAAVIISFTYDDATVNAIGKRVRIQDNARTVDVHLAYDAIGGIERVEHHVGGASAVVNQTLYNDLGKIKLRTFDDGSTMEYSYGRDGKTASVAFTSAGGNSEPLVESVIYHWSGRIEQATLAGGAVRFQANFNPETGRLVGRTYSDATGGDLFIVDQIDHDPVGNVIALTEHLPPHEPVEWRLRYDSLYRLRHSGARQSAGIILDNEYHYDLVGNFIRNDDFAPGEAIQYDPVKPNAVTGTAANPNQFQYDAAGRAIVTDRHSSITWNDRNRAERVVAGTGESLDLLYDQAGELLRVDRTTAGGASRYDFFSADHESHDGTEVYYANLEGSQWAAIHADGSKFVSLRSIGDNVVRVLDQTATPVVGNDELYTPFGNTLVGAPSSEKVRGFADTIRGPERLQVIGARPLLTGLGRFLAPDPVLLDKLRKDLLFEPHRLTSFAYAQNNPRTLTDPSGELAGVDDVILWGVGRLFGWRQDGFKDGVSQNFMQSWKFTLNQFNTVDVWSLAGVAKGGTELALRLTWNLPNEVIGGMVGYLFIEAGGGTTRLFDDVQIVDVSSQNPNVNWAFTIGSKVMGNPTGLEQHEQGHYYQSLILGPLYFIPGLMSVGSFTLDPANHNKFWTERWADSLGKSYWLSGSP